MVQRSQHRRTAVFTASAQVARRDPVAISIPSKMRLEKNVARLTLSAARTQSPERSDAARNQRRILTAGETEGAKLIVLDSACKVFSGGIDIGEYTSQRVFQMLDAFHSAFAAMLEVGKPVVCVVEWTSDRRWRGAGALWRSRCRDSESAVRSA